MTLTREEQAAILLMRDIKNNPMRECKIVNYIGLGWEVSGTLNAGDYGHFDINFTIDCSNSVMGFREGNVFQSVFKFNPEKGFSSKMLEAFAGKVGSSIETACGISGKHPKSD